jgi:hypothetical protein
MQIRELERYLPWVAGYFVKLGKDGTTRENMQRHMNCSFISTKISSLLQGVTVMHHGCIGGRLIDWYGGT